MSSGPSTLPFHPLTLQSFCFSLLCLVSLVHRVLGQSWEASYLLIQAQLLARNRCVTSWCMQRFFSFFLHSKQIPLSSHFPCFSISLKLGKAVTHSGIEGCLCMAVSTHSLCVYLVAFGGRPWVMSSPRVCWQLSLKWGAEMAKLEPEPHVSWGFFYVQCLTPPQWGWVHFPRC